MNLYYYDVSFSFMVLEDSDSLMVCRLFFPDRGDKEWFANLQAKEEASNWYLDSDGNRLAVDALLEVSPWRLQVDAVTSIKLLCRKNDGDVLTFQKKDSYFDYNNVLIVRDFGKNE